MPATLGWSLLLPGLVVLWRRLGKVNPFISSIVQCINCFHILGGKIRDEGYKEREIKNRQMEYEPRTAYETLLARPDYPVPAVMGSNLNAKLRGVGGHYPGFCMSILRHHEVKMMIQKHKKYDKHTEQKGRVLPSTEKRNGIWNLG